LKAVVRNVLVRGNQAVLTLNAGDSEIRATDSGPGTSTNLVDALVQVQGVCTTIFSDQRRLQGVELQVPGWAQVQISEVSKQDPFTLPASPVNELLKFHTGINGLHRVRVVGSVVHRLRDGSFFLEDGSGGILVQPAEKAAEVQVGSAVETVGFPSVAEKFPVLQEGLLRPLESGVPLTPAVLDPDAPLSADWHGRLVRLQGRVLSVSSRASEAFLLVQFGPHVIDAIMQRTPRCEPFPGITPGSTVTLTGVYAARVDDRQNVRTFQLLLRTPADITLVSRPSWWTAEDTLWVLGGVVVVLVSVLVWVGSLRRQVHQRTQELRQEIEERKRAQETLVQASRLAGMAEVATSVLHNVGNVLNSVNVSTGLLLDTVRQSKIANLSKAVKLMREHEGDLSRFLSADPKGKQLPTYLSQLAQHLVHERQLLDDELKCLSQNIEHVKNIIAMQQNYANVAGVTETVNACELVEDALRFNEGALARHDVQVVRQYDSSAPVITVDRHKVLQILVNLIRNAKYACDEANDHDKCLTVGVSNGHGRLGITVADNGVGIPEENLTRIFNLGFTTRKDGHGFGLHTSALAARDLGGRLFAESEGPGRGAVFTLELPLAPNG
jgi:signal transduction histidine kinase